MKYIFPYFLVGFCWIGFSISAGDYSEYTVKDVTSFIQEINKDTRLSIVLSDAPTKNLSRNALSRIYREDSSYFSSQYPIKRLIPFHLINETTDRPTILPNIYVPYIFLLEKRSTDLILQIKENGWRSDRIQSNIVLKLANKVKPNQSMLRAIGLKVELEEVTNHHARKIAMPLAIDQIRSQDGERIQQIYQSHFESRLKLVQRAYQQKLNTMRLDYDHEIAMLKLEIKQQRCTKNTSDLLSQNLCDQQLRIQDQVSFLTLQRNILLCLIPVFIAIGTLTGFLINNKATIT